MEAVGSPETSEHSISTGKKEPKNKTINKKLFCLKLDLNFGRRVKIT